MCMFLSRRVDPPTNNTKGDTFIFLPKYHNISYQNSIFVLGTAATQYHPYLYY